jgi:hypothetical protein
MPGCLCDYPDSFQLRCKIINERLIQAAEEYPLTLLTAAMNGYDPLVASDQPKASRLVKIVTCNVQITVPVFLSPAKAVETEVCTCDVLSNRSCLRLDCAGMWSNDSDQRSSLRTDDSLVVRSFSL